MKLLDIGAACLALMVAACGSEENTSNIDTAQSAGPAEQAESPTDTRETSSSSYEDHLIVSVSGVGPDVVLIPGLASSAEVWAATEAALTDRFTVHTVQVRGFAGTDPGANAETETVLEDLTTALISYTDTLDDSVAVIGHSMGGVLSLKIALSEAPNIDRIMVVDALPFFSVLMNQNATAESMQVIADFSAQQMVSQTDDVFEASQATTLKTLVSSEADQATALEWSLTSDRAVMAQAMKEVLTTDLREYISQITVPVTVVYAFDEAMPAPAPAVEALYQSNYSNIPDLTLVRMDNALHFVMLDQPLAFQESVDRFLAPLNSSD